MPDYTVRISARGVSFEVAGPDPAWITEKEKQYAWLIEAILSHDAQNDAGAGSESQKNTISISSKLSVNEFYRKYIQGKEIKSRPDVATCIIFYMGHVGEKKEFTANEVKEQFRLIGYPAWNSININDVLNKAKQKALLNSVNNLWSLSITGEDFVLGVIATGDVKKKT